MRGTPYVKTVTAGYLVLINLYVRVCDLWRIGFGD